MSACERFFGFKDDTLKTDVLYWIGDSKLNKFYFDTTIYGLTQYKFDSDFIYNAYYTLFMKQILINSNWINIWE